MALRDLKSTGLSVLTCKIVESSQQRCSECCDDCGGELLQYATRIGTRVRVHGGLFCSKQCHDRYHGLAPR